MREKQRRAEESERLAAQLVCAVAEMSRTDPDPLAVREAVSGSENAPPLSTTPTTGRKLGAAPPAAAATAARGLVIILERGIESPPPPSWTLTQDKGTRAVAAEPAEPAEEEAQLMAEHVAPSAEARAVAAEARAAAAEARTRHAEAKLAAAAAAAEARLAAQAQQAGEVLGVRLDEVVEPRCVLRLMEEATGANPDARTMMPEENIARMRSR